MGVEAAGVGEDEEAGAVDALGTEAQHGRGFRGAVRADERRDRAHRRS